MPGDAAPSGLPMAAFHLPMRFGQRQVLERQPIVHDQRMLFQRWGRAPGCLAVELSPLVWGALDE
jgi:hypothetical protein